MNGEEVVLIKQIDAATSNNDRNSKEPVAWKEPLLVDNAKTFVSYAGSFKLEYRWKSWKSPCEKL